LAAVDRRSVTPLDQGSDATEIRTSKANGILEWFSRECREYYAFVYFRVWTGTRPSEAIALRWATST
jgi:hypothetical protein